MTTSSTDTAPKTACTWAGLDNALQAETPDRDGGLPPPRPRLGVLGGTFDPIHIGHLLLAQEAADIMDLDRVYFVPAGCPPHKPDQPVTPVRHRVNMARLATRSNVLFGVSELDADESSPSFTVDLMQRLQSRLPLPADIYFLMGLDSLKDLPTWHNPAWLLEHCNMVALSRPDVRIDWDELSCQLPGARERIAVLEMPGLEVSGLDVRARIMEGKPVRYLLTPEVIEYIRRHRLYESDDEKQRAAIRRDRPRLLQPAQTVKSDVL